MTWIRVPGCNRHRFQAWLRQPQNLLLEHAVDQRELVRDRFLERAAVRATVERQVRHSGQLETGRMNAERAMSSRCRGLSLCTATPGA